MKKKYKLLGYDKSNGKDYSCKLYGYIKKGVIYIMKEEIKKETSCKK